MSTCFFPILFLSLSLRLLSSNVKEFWSQDKQREVVQFVQEKRYDLLFLQENVFFLCRSSQRAFLLQNLFFICLLSVHRRGCCCISAQSAVTFLSYLER